MVPKRITVKAILQSRYSELDQDSGLLRPASWDQRTAGTEIVLDENGQKVKLLSNGGQSTPQEGWELILISGNDQEGYEWTLYSLTEAIQN